MRVALAIGPCMLSLPLLGQEVHYNYDRDANFAKYKTHRWIQIRRGVIGDQLLDQDIRRAIEAELTKKGLVRGEQASSLFAVAYQASLGRQKQLNSWGNGARWGGMGTGQARTETIETGNLVVDFYDPAEQQLVWRGVASQTPNISKDPDKNYKHLEKAASKLLSNFPPKPGK